MAPQDVGRLALADHRHCSPCLQSCSTHQLHLQGNPWDGEVPVWGDLGIPEQMQGMGWINPFKKATNQAFFQSIYKSHSHC